MYILYLTCMDVYLIAWELEWILRLVSAQRNIYISVRCGSIPPNLHEAGICVWPTEV